MSTVNLSYSILLYKSKLNKANVLQIYNHFSNTDISLLFLFYKKSNILETILFLSVDNTGFLKVVFSIIYLIALKYTHF